MERHDRAGMPLAALLLVMTAALLGGCSRGEGTGAAGAAVPVPASTGAADADATHGLEGVWVFAQGPSFPGPRYLRIRRVAGQLQGALTTDWYGDVPMNALRIVDGVAHFEIDNGNAKLPAKPWTATLRDGALQVVGDIWSTHVDIVGRRGDETDAARLAFPAPVLPAWQPLPADGLVQTPPMGWSSWNTFADKIDDATIRGIADAMVASGLRDAGYRYINIDDGWQGERDADGVLQPNAHFPDMRALADYVHARGLKLGIYSSPGPKTCAGYAGSYGHVEQDARTWAGWGIDYVKYDLCSGEGIFRAPDQVRRAYLAMGQALRATGRPIVYSLCQYGRDQVGRWGREVGGHLWRTTGDIEDRYEVMAKIGFEKNGDAADAGPGGFNDPDMLEVGNGGMSEDEYRTHMALWAMSAAPLLLGNDLRRMTPATRALLRNSALIAIDQDPLGRQGHALRRDGEVEVWQRPLAGGADALAVFNRGDAQRDVALAATDAGTHAGWRDAWTGARLPRVPATVRVPAHGVVLLYSQPSGG
jgi:alpha-galactosidase